MAQARSYKRCRAYGVAGLLALLQGASGFVSHLGFATTRLTDKPVEPQLQPWAPLSVGDKPALAAAALLDAPATRKAGRKPAQAEPTLIDASAFLRPVSPKKATKKATKKPATAPARKALSASSTSVSASSRTSSSSSSSPSSSSAPMSEASVQATIKDLQLMAAALNAQRKLAVQLERSPRNAEWAGMLGLSEAALQTVIGRGARARLLLVQMFTPMVMMLVRKYSMGVATTDLADMAGEGYLGIIQGALAYNPNKGSKFSTFVWFYIRKRVILAANENSRVGLHRSRSDKGQVKLLRKTQQYLKGMSEEPVTAEQVASRLNVTVDRVHALKRMARSVVSAEQLGASETIADGSVPLFGRLILESSREEAIERCMSRLDPEERFVLAHRSGLVDGVAKSWDELQRLMDGCGVSYLKKVEMRAKAHLMRDREFSTLMMKASSPMSVFASA